MENLSEKVTGGQRNVESEGAGMQILEQGYSRQRDAHVQRPWVAFL